MTSTGLILITYNDHGVEKKLRIKKEIAPKWNELASVLGFSDGEIQSIRMSNHHQEVACAEKMLMTWMQRDGDGTWHKLILKMRDVELGSAAADLAKALRNRID